MVSFIAKLLRMFIQVIGFLVVICGLTLFLAKLVIPKRQFDVLIASSGAFIKKSIRPDAFAYAGEPNKLEKLWVNTKLLLKDVYYPPCGDTVYSEKLFGYTLAFTDYFMFFSLVNEIFTHKIYAFELPHEPFILDAGSNIGVSILFFKKMYPGAKIIGFEPSKRNFDLLEKNIHINNLDQVQVVNKALSDKEDEEIKLYNAGTTSCSMYQSEKKADYEVMRTTKLSGYIKQKVDLLKIDIEGAEYDVFQELFDSGTLQFIEKIIMEYHEPLHRLAGLLDIFNKSGFVYEIRDGLIYAYKKN